MRGLRWIDVDFDARGLNINQRADASHRIGKLKSKAAYRSIPCPPIMLNALREWKLLCPKSGLGLVFPNGIGKVESHANLLERDFEGVQLAAGVTEVVQAKDTTGKPVLDAAGAPVMLTAGKYGLHALRHACASLWIESGYNPKQIQRLMGHSSIKVTFNVYGHLFADPDADQKAAENVQARLLRR